MFVRLLSSRYFVWALLALPGAYMTYAYRQENLFYGEFLHATGELATRLLILTLAITPLGMMFPSASWVRWLRRRRRYFGVAVFGYALLHAVAYLERQAPATIIADAAAAWMWTGWVALILLLALAVTSNDWAMRALRRRWKILHRAVYAAALLSFAHWILSAFDPLPAYLHLGVLALLEGYRVASPSVRHVLAHARSNRRSTSRR